MHMSRVIPICKQFVCTLVDNIRGWAVIEIRTEVEAVERAFSIRCQTQRSLLNQSFPRIREPRNAGIHTYKGKTFFAFPSEVEWTFNRILACRIGH